MKGDGYYICCKDRSDLLANEVNRYLEAGFKLVGQPFAVYNKVRFEVLLFQAVYRKSI